MRPLTVVIKIDNYIPIYSELLPIDQRHYQE